MSHKPYELYTDMVGHEGFDRQKITVMNVPRADYVEAMNRMLDREVNNGHLGVELADRLRKVAETQQRFPLDTWMNPERGCGCLVGEYLVASEQVQEIAKAQAAEIEEHLATRKYAAKEFSGGYYDVELALHRDLPTEADALIHVGQEADEEVTFLLFDKSDDEVLPSVVLIVD